MPRAGIVTVVGKPNVGKSTLLNRIIGQKLSITSSKPQSTRDRIVGIRSDDDAQMVILDTPGLLEPRYELQRVMRSTALRALEDADVIVYLVDAHDPAPVSLEEAAALERAPGAPVIQVFNKIDTLEHEAREALLGRAAQDHSIVPISATSGEGVDDLLERISALLPESPFLYPEDEIATQSLRFFTAELIRETTLEQLEEEVPYSVACEVEEFREERRPIYIRAVIYVERPTQKQILIGRKGERIREIGRAARLKIEELVGAPVYLDLWVKVLANWRRNAKALRRFGYKPPEDTAS
ncbi:MAG TPA: GTPase Era [Gemmatimonadaceae bacterium]|nr:GTPase Era [Gemmatimonadaceae bacterium]